MNRHLFGTAGALVAVLLATGCAEDPTAALRGEAATIVFSRNYVEMSVGQTLQMNAKAYDAQGNVIPLLPEVISADPNIVSITVDPLLSGDPIPETRFEITAVAPGQVALTASSGSASATANVTAFPVAFNGAVAVDQSGRLDVVTLSSTAALTFDPAASEVFIDGLATRLMSITADQIVVTALTPSALTGATVTVTNVVFLGSIPAGALDATTLVDIRAEPGEPLNNGLAGAEPYTLGTTIVGAVSGSDADDYFTFTLAAGATVTVDCLFGGTGADPDIDLYLLDSGGNEIDHSWFDNPESITATLAAGTYYVQVQLYDSGGKADPHWYEIVVN